MSVKKPTEREERFALIEVGKIIAKYTPKQPYTTNTIDRIEDILRRLREGKL